MRQSSLAAYLLIAVGIYFLLPMLPINLPLDLSWPFFLLLLGLAVLFDGLINKVAGSLFTGVLLTGVGIHFFVLRQLSWWDDQWGVYVFILGIALLVKGRQQKTGMWPAFLLIAFGLIGLFLPTLPSWLSWVETVFVTVKQYWPLLLIGTGIIMLRKK